MNFIHLPREIAKQPLVILGFSPTFTGNILAKRGEELPIFISRVGQVNWDQVVAIYRRRRFKVREYGAFLRTCFLQFHSLLPT